MKDSQQIDLTPEQSWNQAEKMLDRHFRKKKIIIWSVCASVAALVMLTSSVLIHKSSNSNSPVNGEIVSSQPDNRPSQNKPAEIIFPEKKDGSTFSHDSHVAVVKDNEKINPASSTSNKAGDKKIAHKPTTVHPSLVSSLNTDHLKSNSKNSEYLQTEASKNPSSENAATVTGPATATITSPTVSSMEEVKFPVVILMDPIHASQIPLASADLTPVSKNESSLPPLSKSKCELKFSVYGGAHYVSKKVESNSFAEYVDRRKNEEEGVITASFGVSASRAVKKFSVSVGFEYSAWGEKNLYLPYLNKKNAIENGHYEDFNTIDVDTIYIWGNQWFVYDTIPDSSFISHIDTVTKNMYDASVFGANNTNRYYFFEVPIEISYRCSHNKFGLGATVGISPAWLITKSGYYLNKDVSGVELISDIKSLNSFVLNGRISLDLFYKMSGSFSLVMRPQIKANLNSIFRDDYGVNQRYYATGLLLGLEYSIR